MKRSRTNLERIDAAATSVDICTKRMEVNLDSIEGVLVEGE